MDIEHANSILASAGVTRADLSALTRISRPTVISILQGNPARESKISPIRKMVKLVEIALEQGTVPIYSRGGARLDVLKTALKKGHAMAQAAKTDTPDAD